MSKHAEPCLWYRPLLDKVREALQDDDEVAAVHAKRDATHHREPKVIFSSGLAAVIRHNSADDGRNDERRDGEAGAEPICDGSALSKR